MNFIDWMNMSMVGDISFLVFAAAVVWKFTKTKKALDKLELKIDAISSRVAAAEKDLHLTMKNPAAAKRSLKQRL